MHAKPGDRIVIETQEPGVRIIDKTGPLTELAFFFKDPAGTDEHAGAGAHRANGARLGPGRRGEARR